MIINNHINSNIFNRSCSGPCLVLGSGPSLKKLETTKQWSNYYSISCNWTQLKFPSQIYTWQDMDLISNIKYTETKKQTISCSILPTSKKTLYNYNLMSNIFGIYVDRKVFPNGRPNWIDTKDSTTVQSCSPITGVISLILAYTMGFSPIIAIGFDCSHNDYKYAYIHKRFKYFNRRGANIHAKTQEKFIKNFHKDLNIINCSYYDQIPQSNLTETLNSLGKNNRISSINTIKELFLSSISIHNKKVKSLFLMRKEII